MHYDKLIAPAGNITLGESELKWYNLAKGDEPIPDEIYDLSRSFLSDNVDTEALGELGFIILHRCGADFYFLLLSSWKNRNELWETVYAKQNDAQPDFAEFPIDDPHHATFCIWELAAVWHEQQAFKRFLYSSQNTVDRDEYLSDQYHGVA